jgi:N-acetylglutamate synthase-like GNAT family acetyltransferase
MKIRKAVAKDLNTIYRMGFDAWSEGKPMEEYLQGCVNSTNYKIGTWFVLEKQGEVVASLIVYQDALNLPARSIGIGSVATVKKYQRRGFASLLVEQICRLYKSSGFELVYLFSEIGSQFYEKLGFQVVKGDCMVKPLRRGALVPDAIPKGF